MNLDCAKNTNTLFRNKVIHTSFFLSILVIFMHSNNLKYYELDIDKISITYMIEIMISYVIGACTVPIFFMISGFNFFQNIDINSKSSFNFILNKQKKRIKTLVIPYLIWNTIGTLFYMILPKIPVVSKFINGGEIEITIQNILKGILFHSYYFPLWYLGYLIILICITPIIAYVLKDKRITFIFIVILVLSQLSDTKFIILSPSSILFFMIGCIFAIYAKDRFKKRCNYNISILLSVLFLVLCIVRYYTLNNLIGNIIYLIQPLILWFAIDIFNNKKEPLNFERQSFFIYCSHIIIVTSVNKVLLILGKYIPGNKWVIISYLISPLITLFIIYIIYKFMKDKLPQVYSIICGNRG